MTQSDRIARTRKRILDHAEELFLRDGFSRVGMDDVADRSGTGKATVYRHFGSKDELFDAVMERYFTRLSANVMTAVQREGSSVDKVKSLVAQLAEELSHLGSGFWHDLKRYRYEKYRVAMEYRRRIANHNLGAIIEHGQCTGEFRTDVPRSIVTTIVLSTLEQLFVTPDDEMKGYTYGEIVEMVVNVAIFGIVRTG